ncbi:hypothetical protein JOD57_003697 [Geodermatophilus bullaregiensis]|nr:DUF222 domain-containing protein [Geodermatophilus bullaregiensis]MBM7807860.1 hypothetical protein [Geodermatophilus bullaregiensis]
MCSGHLASGDVLDDVAALVAERNRIDAALARRVRTAELTQAPERDGLKSVASWLRGHCRLSAAAAGRLVTAGRVLEHLPALAEAHDTGLVSAEQVAVAARAVTPERLAAAAAQGVDLAVIDAVFTGVAIEQEHAALGPVVQRYLDDLDPDGPEPDPTEGRSLTLSKHADGALSIRGQLDAAGGEKLQAVLESVVQADRPAGDDRSRAQRLGDALVQLADNALASGSLPTLRTVKPHVAVVIDLADLVDPGTRPGAVRMGFGAVISAARARWLACDATVSRVVMGPDGAPLDLGREQRLADRPAPPQGPAASSRVAGGRGGPFTGGPRCTTSCTGSTAARPHWPTPPCCANGTTPRSTTASASSDDPTGDGTPGDPTAPRSSPGHHSCNPQRDPPTHPRDRPLSQRPVARACAHPARPQRSAQGRCSLRYSDGQPSEDDVQAPAGRSMCAKTLAARSGRSETNRPSASASTVPGSSSATSRAVAEVRRPCVSPICADSSSGTPSRTGRR